MLWRIFFVAVVCCGGCRAAATLSSKDVVDRALPATETVLGPQDFASAPEKEIDLRQLGIAVPDDPTLGNHSEGDIASPQLNGVQGVARDAIRQTYRKWPGGEIPYSLSSQYGSYARSVIAKAMAEYHSKTCIRFVPRDERRHRDYVFIHPDDGCYSLVGRTGGRQPLSLDSGCIQTGTIVHELMHSVGFFHEQSRTDRDQFIEIRWENVMKGADDQFEKYGPAVIQDLGEPYDYSSIMHYGPYAFSDNGKRTIVALKAGADRMGQRVAFSDLDLRKINKLYECPQPGPQGNSVVEAPAPAQVCEDNNWRCRFWAISMLGYCDSYEEIRTIVCPKSCGTCSSPGFGPSEVPQCQDKHPNCVLWRQLGQCDEQSSAMRSLCAASCGLCSAQNPPSPSGICSDQGAGFFTCKSALLLGRCERHRVDCARTCGFC
uniref:Metalloendopeptidase n=1 Tax=Steinernema glaseri TaxID=37863 RepID=A0A1I8AF85_9BILA